MPADMPSRAMTRKREKAPGFMVWSHQGDTVRPHRVCQATIGSQHEAVASPTDVCADASVHGVVQQTTTTQVRSIFMVSGCRRRRRENWFEELKARVPVD